MASNASRSQTRDVKNHLLFEIATEVAHRGMALVFGSHCATLLGFPH